MVRDLTCQRQCQSNVDYACEEGDDIFDVDDGYSEESGGASVDCSGGDGVVTLVER